PPPIVMEQINCTQTPGPSTDEPQSNPERADSETTNQCEDPPPPAQEDVPHLTDASTT
ncbi:hypothetical protein M9458_004300, partial [Cirrhinus mrigala]